MSESLTTRQAAEALGISARTLRQWLRTIPLSVTQDEGGEYRLTRSDLERLSLIRAWRASGKSLRELRERVLDHRARKVEAERAAERPAPSLAPVDSTSELNTESGEPDAVPVDSQLEPRAGSVAHDIQTLVQALVPAVTSAIREDMQRAERFAQLAHRVGELEATLRERDRELGETRLRLAEAPSQASILELEKTVAIQQMELDLLRQQMAKRKPWFAFWR